MSRWIEQFKTHPFNADWTRLTEVLSTPLADERNTPVGIAQEYARLRKVIEYIQGVLENLDPELLPQSFLGNMHGYVQNAVNEVNAFKSNGSLGHLQNANAHADQLMVFACQGPFTAFGTVKANLTKAAVQYAETMSRHAVAYASRTDGLIEESAGKLNDLNQRVVAADEAVTKLDSRVDGVETTVQGQLSTFNSTFQGSENTRAEKYDQWFVKFQEKTDSNFVDMVKKTDATLGVLDDYQERAEKVLGTVIDTAQAGAYAKYASEEKQSANTYRRAAILLMAAAALVLFLPELAHALKAATEYSVDWQKALARLPFSLILFAPALYLAKESSKHRLNEVSNRRRQHILTTIGPYLALLDDKKAQEIKSEVAKSIFADTAPVEDKSADTANLLAQLSNLVSAVTKKG